MNLTKIKMSIKIIGLSFLLIFPLHSKEFSVGWELWYPYQFTNKNNVLTGLDIEVFNLISKKANMSISYFELPWQRHLMYIKSGMTDIAFGASFTESRGETAYFSLPYREEIVNLFVKKGTKQTIHLTKLSDLIGSKYLIGVENGYYYGEEYQKLETIPEFISSINGVLDIKQNVKMLMKGHIDGFLADPITMQSFVKKNKLQNEFEIHPLPVYKSDIFIMLSKKTCTVDDLAKINEAILALQKNGEMADIIQNWSKSK
ncbi:MAG: transporter substrate-binding domain-containing protein [Litorilituus sp.]|jgi:polar amino acid transport system substrate-binding protein|nr:transporter substrate-binding domain-containing protein [Litorilituus sp.]